jgi:putative flippase GtrA
LTEKNAKKVIFANQMYDLYQKLGINYKTVKKIAATFLILPTDDILIQVGRYFFTGGLAFVIDFSFLYVLTNKFHFYYLVSAAVSFSIGLIVNFFLCKIWIFKKAVVQSKIIEFFFVLLIGAIGLLLNEIFIWFFTDKIKLFYLLSKIITAAIVLAWNFLARKLTLYNLPQS